RAGPGGAGRAFQPLAAAGQDPVPLHGRRRAPVHGAAGRLPGIAGDDTHHLLRGVDDVPQHLPLQRRRAALQRTVTPGAFS
ncbi:hypothetical protein WDZ92_36100, partial [Nostoc sp. NIES-2111]